jgi:serine/threonine-protein kinase
MDFGLAKMSTLLYISPDELVDFTLPATAGTPEYISPEQVRGSEMDSRGDLYSVGVILYEMLTGKRPFEYGSARELLLAHADEPPPPFADKGVSAEQVPPAIEAVVLGCLAKFPDHRPATARDLALSYEQALGRKITTGRRTGFGPGAVASATPRPAAPRTAVVPTVPSTTTPAPRLPVDRQAVEHSVEAVMPESMAMIKLKGFIFDLGGEVVESVPGMIRVRVPEPQAEKKKSGLFGWGSKSAPLVQIVSATELELHMERRDPGQPSKLTVTLVMRATGGLITPEWRNRCNQIGRDLQAYLMGR